MASPNNIAMPEGAHAARVGGIFSERPNAKTTSEKKYNKNPVSIPPAVTKAAPLLLDCRRVNVAEISTIAHIRSGEESRLCH